MISVGCLWICLLVAFCGCASFTYFGQLLRCPHKRIVNIMKVYIKRNNIQMELIRFRKLASLLTFETLKWIYTTDVLSVTRRHWSVAGRTFRKIVTSGHVISGQAQFGTAQLHHLKLLCTGSSHGNSVQAPIRL